MQEATAQPETKANDTLNGNHTEKRRQKNCSVKVHAQKKQIQKNTTQ